MFDKEWEIRDFTQEDKAFVMASALRGLYYGDSWFSVIPKRVFMDNYKHILEAIINKHMVKVACMKVDKNQILGYSILSKDLSTIHWVFVKTLYRKQGIGKSLLPHSADTVTHLTALGKNLMNKIPQLIFNPFKV